MFRVRKGQVAEVMSVKPLTSLSLTPGSCLLVQGLELAMGTHAGNHRAGDVKCVARGHNYINQGA